MFGAVHRDFSLIDGDFLTSPAVTLEGVFQPVEPLLIASYNQSTNGSIRRYERPAWRKNATGAHCSAGVSSWENTSCWRVSTTMRLTIINSPTYPCSAVSFTLRLTPCPDPIEYIIRPMLHIILNENWSIISFINISR